MDVTVRITKAVNNRKSTVFYRIAENFKEAYQLADKYLEENKPKNKENIEIILTRNII